MAQPRKDRTPLLARLNRPVADFVGRIPVRVRTKLYVAFLAMVALLVLLGAIGLEVLGDTNRRSDTLIESEQKMAQYRLLQLDTGHILATTGSALWLSDQAKLDQTSREIEELLGDLDRLGSMPADEAALVTELRQEYDRFIVTLNRIVTLIRANNVDQAGKVQIDEALPLADTLNRLTTQLAEKAQAGVVAAIELSHDAYRMARMTVIAFAVGAILFGLYLGYTLSSFVIGPIDKIGARLSELAAGEFTGHVVVVNRDELGWLAADVNRTSEQLGRFYQALEAEKERSEGFLAQMLPRRIIERMGRGEALIADYIPEATILFSDLVGFTALSGTLAPVETAELLDLLFSRFDALADRLGLEKIKTIGDGYMVAGGVLETRPDHAAAVTEMGLEMHIAAATATRALGFLGQPLQLRIGLHSGPLVAGVIGKRKFVYDVWGDTVNIASRMEKYGEPGRVHISAATRTLLDDGFEVEPRGAIEVKGKGLMETFFVARHHPIGP